MKENRIGQTVRKEVKRTEVHPLCSRKRALSKIIASPTYQERQKKAIYCPKEKKKEENDVQKFEYLRRKKRYGDDLLKKNKNIVTSKQKLFKETPCNEALSSEKSKPWKDLARKTPKMEEKEYIHPLCSRQQSLAKIVASSSYKLSVQSMKDKNSMIKISPFDTSKDLSSNIPQGTPALERRYTIMPSMQMEGDKENLCNLSDIASPSYTSTIRKMHAKDRRLTTFAKWKPHDEDTSFVVDKDSQANLMNSPGKEKITMTPWKNNKMSMRERLDLWLAAKNKTPTPARPKFKKSPYPNKKFKSVANLGKLSEENSYGYIEESNDCNTSEENGTVIGKELEAIVRKFENHVSREEIEKNLDELISRYTTIVKFADYWICKARLASLDDDVRRVICLLEQAHTFQAQPGDKIKEEICRYLELLESSEKNGNKSKQVEEGRERLVSLYAVTPGRKVHFAAAESPIDFKSSMIRFCLLESKAFKRRLNAQLKRKVLTPVRRSLRVEKSDLPEFLRTDSRVVGSPGEVEGDIIDGEISFVPNKSLNTPLNKGWLIQDETKIDSHLDETNSNRSENDSPKNETLRDERKTNHVDAADEILSPKGQGVDQVYNEARGHEIHDETNTSADHLEEIELSFM